MRQVFVGDSARLVDQLVESSQIKPPANSTYTGAGRELIPFFDMHEPVGHASLMGSLESTPARKAGSSQRGSPRKSAGGRKDAGTIKPEPAAARGGSSSPSQRRGSPGRASPRKFPKAAPQAIASAAPAPAFRCPGFAQSPKPELVPMPTFGLLQRAVARSFASTCKTSTPSSFANGVSGMLPALQVAA